MKGESTRATILDEALRLASLEGLDALSIGRLAKGVGLSKSGLFAHFNSKEALQLQVLAEAAEVFIGAVVRPAIRQPRGLPRLRAIFENWLAWARPGRLPGGCVFLASAVELDDKPGVLRDYLVQAQRDWVETLARSVRIAQQEAHLPLALDPQQFAFEIYGAMMSYHLYSRLLGDPTAEARARDAFERLISSPR